MDACFNTADDTSTLIKNLMNVGPVTPEFCGRVCAGRATCWALPCIFVFIVIIIIDIILCLFSAFSFRLLSCFCSLLIYGTLNLAFLIIMTMIIIRINLCSRCYNHVVVIEDSCRY